MPEEQSILTPYLGKLSVTRLIVMLETRPQSNEYRQIALTREQFKIFSDGLIRAINPTDEVSLVFNMNNSIAAKLNERAEDFYTPEEIRKMN